MRIKIVLCVLCVTAAHQWTITATSTRAYTHIIVLAAVTVLSLVALISYRLS